MNRLLLFFLCLLPMVLSAQTLLKGRVFSEEGVPIGGVNVVSVTSGKGVSTDSTGTFQLRVDVPCVLKFSHIGYHETTQRVGGDDVVIVLRALTHSLNSVEVVGMARAGVVYTSQQQIERVPSILGEQDILKYMATMPGVATTNALDPGIYVRGGNSTENAFLVNDVEIANPNHLSGILSTYDPYVLSRSAIYKSGFPVKFNDYLSSYINMFPEVGNKQAYEGEATVGLLSSALKAQGPLVKGRSSMAVSVRASYLQHIAKFYNKVNDVGEMPSYSFYDATLSVDSRLAEGLTGGVFGLFTTDRLNIRINKSIEHRLNWNTFSGIGRLSYLKNDNALTLKMGYNSGDADINTDGRISMSGENRKQTATGILQYDRPFGEKWVLSGGVKFEHTHFLVDGVEEESGYRYFNLYTTFLGMKYDYDEHWSAEGGVNYQYYSGNSRVGTWSPRLKMNYKREGWSVWADYAKTVQYLAQYSFFTMKSPIDVWYPLEQGAKPAECHQYSLGVDKEFFGCWYVYAAVFLKKMKHLKDFSSGLQTEFLQLKNRQIEGTGTAKGMELDVIFNNERTYFRANYTLSESERRFDEINNGRSFHPPYDMKHNILFNGSYALMKRFTLNLLWTYTSGTYVTFPVGVAIAQDINNMDGAPDFVPIYRDRYNYKLPDNHRLDVSGDYEKEYRKYRLKVSMGVYNVYNQQNPTFVYFEPETKDKYYTRFVPKSKVLLPFIPYVSVTLKW